MSASTVGFEAVDMHLFSYQAASSYVPSAYCLQIVLTLMMNCL